MHAGSDRARDVFGFTPVVAGDDDDVAGMLGGEAIQEVGTGMNDGPPRRWILAPRVVAVDLLQVIGEIGTIFGIDVHGRVDARIHRLLQECRVEMAGIEDDESHHSKQRTQWRIIRRCR